MAYKIYWPEKKAAQRKLVKHLTASEPGALLLGEAFALADAAERYLAGRQRRPASLKPDPKKRVSIVAARSPKVGPRPQALTKQVNKLVGRGQKLLEDTRNALCKWIKSNQDAVDISTTIAQAAIIFGDPNLNLLILAGVLSGKVLVFALC